MRPEACQHSIVSIACCHSSFPQKAKEPFSKPASGTFVREKKANQEKDHLTAQLLQEQYSEQEEAQLRDKYNNL